MSRLFASLVLASHLTVPAADRVPTFDASPSCRGAATMGFGATLQNCMDDETSARDQVIKEWAQFAAGDKKSCTDAMRDFEPSYVELLTCLEAARDAKQTGDE